MTKLSFEDVIDSRSPVSSVYFLILNALILCMYLFILTRKEIICLREVDMVII